MFRIEVHKTQHFLYQIAIRLVGDHLDLFQHIYRHWHGEADCHSFETEDKVEAIRSYFDEGVSNKEDKKVKNRTGAVWPNQIAGHIDDQLGLNPKTVVDVAFFFHKGGHDHWI